MMEKVKKKNQHILFRQVGIDKFIFGQMKKQKKFFTIGDYLKVIKIYFLVIKQT
jgi:hypothetical protein